MLPKLIEAVALVLSLVGPVLVIMNWSFLPDVIPIHFGLSGKPDGWGNKAILAVVGGESIFIYTLLSIGQVHKRPNLPWKIRDEMLPVQLALVSQLLVYLKLETSILFAYLCWAMIDTAKGLSQGLSPYFTPVLIVAIIATICNFFIRSYKAR